MFISFDEALKIIGRDNHDVMGDLDDLPANKVATHKFSEWARELPIDIDGRPFVLTEHILLDATIKPDAIDDAIADDLAITRYSIRQDPEK